jgi:ubiquitin C-terminal hydrolase
MQSVPVVPEPESKPTLAESEDMPLRDSYSQLSPVSGPAIDTLSIALPDGTVGSNDVIALPPPPDVIPGVIGLQNIGNTCFMNSVLQCLLHCRPLCEYFLSGQYREEVNESNPLGSGGKLVREFARLVEQVWHLPHDRVVVPRDLKYVIGQHQPMFMGYQQQDSQELVTFLLDGLHEDLNLVKQKPYTEAIEANGRPDDLVARLCWDQHLLRNKSRIVDIFQGQYKSRLRCPHCSKSSVTFDPFMFLSLPIPSQPDLPLLVTFTYAQVEPANLPPIRLAVNVFRDASDLGQAIAAAVSAELPPEYSDTIITDDIVVFTQSTTYSSFQEIDGTNFYATSSLAAKKRVFCSFAPRLAAVGSPTAAPLSTTPQAKRQKNHNIVVSVQTRVCPKSKWTVTSKDRTFDQAVEGGNTITPSLGYTPVGCPTLVSISNAATVPELIAALKRTVIYSVGVRSKDLFEGIRNGAVARVVEHGFTVATQLIGNSAPQTPEEEPLTIGEIFSGIISKNDNKKIQLNIFVDVPVEDKSVSPVDQEDGDEVMDAPVWDDILANIQGRINDYYRTENSWKQTSVMGLVSNTGIGNRVSINDCFRLFSSEEVLGAEDQWYCSNCKTHVQASKKIDLWKMPNVLIVHLKRFQFTRGFRNKIESIIEFPFQDDEVLDVAEFLPEGALDTNHEGLKYKLFGISNHMGSLYSGHYTAYAKLWEDPKSPTKRRRNVCHRFFFEKKFLFRNGTRSTIRSCPGWTPRPRRIPPRTSCSTSVFSPSNIRNSIY